MAKTKRVGWVTDYKRRVADLECYANELERREQMLIQTLEEITRGCVPADWSGRVEHGMQRLAGKRLQEMAVRRMKSRPLIW